MEPPKTTCHAVSFAAVGLNLYPLRSLEACIVSFQMTASKETYRIPLLQTKHASVCMLASLSNQVETQSTGPGWWKLQWYSG